VSSAERRRCDSAPLSKPAAVGPSQTPLVSARQGRTGSRWLRATMDFGRHAERLRRARPSRPLALAVLELSPSERDRELLAPLHRGESRPASFNVGTVLGDHRRHPENGNGDARSGRSINRAEYLDHGGTSSVTAAMHVNMTRWLLTATGTNTSYVAAGFGTFNQSGEPHRLRLVMWARRRIRDGSYTSVIRRFRFNGSLTVGPPNSFAADRPDRRHCQHRQWPGHRSSGSFLQSGGVMTWGTVSVRFGSLRSPVAHFAVEYHISSGAANDLRRFVFCRRHAQRRHHYQNRGTSSRPGFQQPWCRQRHRRRRFRPKPR